MGPLGALFGAAAAAAAGVACAILSGGIEADAFDGTNQLHKAALRGDLPRVAQLLSSRVPVDTRSADKLTPLHYAARLGRHQVTAPWPEPGRGVAKMPGFSALRAPPDRRWWTCWWPLAQIRMQSTPGATARSTTLPKMGMPRSAAASSPQAPR